VAKISFGHPIDLMALGKHFQKWPEEWPWGVSLYYNPKFDPALNLYFKKPRAIIRLMSTGKLICMQCRSEKEVRQAIQKTVRILSKLGFVLKKKIEEPKIINVVCCADIKRKIGCGIIQKVFPKARKSKFGGESFVLPLKEGTIKIFLNGKLLGLGFKNPEKAKITIKKIAERLFLAVEKFDKERAKICKLERINPAIEALRKYGGKFGRRITPKILFGEAEKFTPKILLEEAELLIMRYYPKRIRDTAGHTPKAIAAGALYIASCKLPQILRLSQEEIANAFDLSVVSVRNAYRTIKRTLNIEIE
jgi:TATA-box binding protein (TBP) (component of TFIID and TFIIIB)